MNYDEIALLTIDDVYPTLLVRLGVDLTGVLGFPDTYANLILEGKPSVAEAEAELILFKAEATVVEDKRLKGVELTSRVDKLFDRDAGVPAFRSLYPEISNAALFFKTKILGEVDQKLAEARLVLIEIKEELLIEASDSTKYRRDREKEYPSVSEQLDTIYHEGVDSWKAKIKVIKDKYPKGV
jgi:hypothetical protein